MKKKIVSLALVVALIAIAAMGTLAYFTDTDDATNTFTTGDVAILARGAEALADTWCPAPGEADGEGAEALGNLYQVSNQVTLGRTEQELIATVTALGNQLCDMENALRDKAKNEGRIPLEDMVYRAWGAMTNARLMPMNEFYQHWSNLRLGAAMGLLKLPLPVVDAMLDHAQEAHLCVWAEEILSGAALEEARATRIREMLGMAK